MHTFTPPTPEQRDDAALDAHSALRAELLAPLLRREDAGAIVDRVTSGDELRIELEVLTLEHGAFLIGATSDCIARGTLNRDAAETADLVAAIGAALEASVNAEPLERRLQIAEGVKTQRGIYAMLRIHAGSETLVLRLGNDTPPVWVAQRVIEMAPEHRLKPTLH